MKIATLTLMIALAVATPASADYIGKTPPGKDFWENTFPVNNDRIEYQGQSKISENEYMVFVNVFRGSTVPQPTRIMVHRLEDGRWIATGLFGAYSAGMQKILR